VSHTTENLHVRGVGLPRVIAAIEKRLGTHRFERVPDRERARAEKSGAELLRVTLRRDGAWTTIALVDEDLEAWGEHLSRELDRSVLTIWTWDGESSVIATRWKRGKKKGRLDLLQEAYRGDDGRARAPAKVLWPWLPKEERAALLLAGIPLVDRATGAGTGDRELDKLLDGFDDVEASEVVDADAPDVDDAVYVPLETSVHAIGAAVGMANPLVNPWDEAEGDLQLVFRRAR
jgi:hypothetical protein